MATSRFHRAPIGFLMLVALAAFGLQWMPARGAAVQTMPVVLHTPPARSGLMATMAGGRLYVAGGVSTDDRDDRRFHCVHPETGRWSELPELPRGRSLGAMATVGEKLYLAGGVGSGAADHVDVFDLRAQQWLEPILHPGMASRLAAVASGDRLYLIGGMEPNATSNETMFSGRVEAFDVKSGRWEALAAPLEGRHGHAAAVADGWIYISGGYVGGESSRSVERYSIAENRWESVAPLEHDHTFHGMARLGEQLHVFGSRNDKMLTEIRALNAPVEAPWQAGPPLPSPRNRFGTAVGEGAVYLVDGENDHGEPSPGIWVLTGPPARWESLLARTNALPAGGTTTGPHSDDRPDESRR